jgi:hypothetical protein
VVGLATDAATEQKLKSYLECAKVGTCTRIYVCSPVARLHQKHFQLSIGQLQAHELSRKEAEQDDDAISNLHERSRVMLRH